MSCVCTFGYEEGDEYSQMWREGRVQSTRKPYRCCECGDLIPVGSRCCYASALFDGSWTTWRRCVSCATLAELVAMKNEACPLWGGLSESCEYAEIDWFEWRQKAREVDAQGPTP